MTRVRLRWGTFAAVVVPVAGCGDPVWDPAGGGDGGQPAMAAVVSETALAADAETLAPWETVFSGLDGPGCAFHLRRATGAYAAREYRLKYSRAARRGLAGTRALVYKVLTTVERPAPDGGTEALPERLGVRAVCSMPDTERGADEAVGRVEAILEARGILEPGGGRALRAGSALAPTPEGGGPGWARAALAWVRDRARARPLLAAQVPSMDELIVTVRRTCEVGFDWDEDEADCVENFVGEGMNSGDGGGPGEGGGSGGSSGGGDGGGDGDGEGGPRTVNFTLRCDASVRRADTAGCAVAAPDSAGVDMSVLEFEWSSSLGAVKGPGKGNSAWNGAATADADVTVKVTDPKGVIAAFSDTETISVTARQPAGRAKLLKTQTAADAIVTHAPPGRWTDVTWGRHAFSTSTIPQPVEGSGPWKDHYMADTSEPVLMNAIYVHPDLTLNDGAPYPTSSISAGRCGAAVGAASANVYAVNDLCGTLGALLAWAGIVTNHELDHQTRLVACLASRDVQDKLRDIEGITGNKADVKREIEIAWEAAEERLADSAEGRLKPPPSSPLWDYRRLRSWTLGPLSPPREGGRTSC